MALDKNDKQFIQEAIKENNTVLAKQLMIWMLQNFLTKDGAVSKDFLDHQLRPIKNQLSQLQDGLTALDSKFTEITIIQQAEIQDI